jgi:cellulose synthase/poly-beta-1,6-N-acetylglucosamine synthase-like glycosyltransferase
MINILLILQYAALFWIGVPLCIFGIYGTIILYYNRSRRKESQNVQEPGETPFEPLLSIVVPTHNESSIISKRIENLLAVDYPADKLEILFVDDSNDSTAALIEDYSKRYTNVHLMHFNERMGYSPCLIAGCKAAKGEIVVLAEASSLFEPETVPALVRNFRDPSIGAVTGKAMLLNTNEEMGKSENLYQRIYNFVRTGESNMDSTIYMKGEAAAVRKSLLTDIETIAKCPGTADTGIGIFARSKGYKFVFDPKVKFYEYAASTNEERVKQKTIRGANLIKVLLFFKSMFFKRKYGKFGMITLPFNLAMLAFVPISILIGFGFLVLLTILEPGSLVFFWVILATVFVGIFAISRHLMVTFFQFEFSLLKAFYEIVFVRKSHDKIDKAASTRRSE